MELIRTVAGMQAHATTARQGGQILALVPTMGALHEGHLALVRAACDRADHVTVSIFVNPTQFAPDEDFEEYPRHLEEDLDALSSVGGVDAVFAPPVDEMYPDGQDAQRVWVDVEALDQQLCGRYRPGHFRGVLTVVMKLIQACKPHLGVFGKKDAQQYLLLRRMVRDLAMEVDLVGVPTVREPDGLAKSSRNRYLTSAERAQAVVLSQAVEAARKRILGGEQRPAAIVEAMRHELAQAPDADVQYAELVDTTTLAPVSRLDAGQEVLAAVAVFFGDTRLIDNAFVRVPPAP
jgi:pantoate--beta-alanine ligase